MNDYHTLGNITQLTTNDPANRMTHLEPERIYLACPYWHKDPIVREERYQLVTRKAAELMLQGYQVFSPITHSHPISAHMPNQDHDFWMKQDYPYIQHWADEVWVYAIDGWRESIGVGLEINYASSLYLIVKIIKL